MTRLVSGDETGLLKLIDADQNTCVRLGDGLQARARGVTQIAAAGDGEAFYVARRDGTLEAWNDDEECQAGWSLGGVVEGVGKDCVGLFALGSGNVVSVDGGGGVAVSSLDAGMAGDVAEIDASDGKGAFHAACAAARGDALLVGGRECDVAMWDLDAGVKTWRARNVPHDKLDMRRPVFVSSCAFTDEALVAVGTAYGELRYYDVRATNRRPVFEKIGAADRGIREVAVSGDGKHLLLGDAAGDCLAYDLTTRRLAKRYPGVCGAVRALRAHPTRESLFAVASLDRHVHVFDASKRTDPVYAAVYAKQRLTALAWLPGDDSDVVGDLADE